MKYDQIDNALLFIGDDRAVVLQHQYMVDRKLIIDHIRDNSPVCNLIDRIVDGMIYLINHDRIILVCISDEVRMQMLDNPNHYVSFFIERRYDRYMEGDTLSDRLVQGRSNTSTMVDRIRKHTDPVSYHSAIIVRQPAEDIDDQTLVLQFEGEHLRSILQGKVRSYKHKCAESFVDQFITVDVFINIGGSIRGKKWLRIVYENLVGNPNPGYRYPGATIVRVDRTLSKPAMTLDMLLEGR